MEAIRLIVQTLRRFDRAAEKHAGLSGAQTFVLQKLSDGQAISVNELAERTHTHQSSVSVAVRKLFDRKLVAREKSESDARRLRLWITRRGRDVLETAPPPAQDRLIEALYRLPPEDCRQLANLLERLTTLAGAAGQTPMLFFEDEGKLRGGAGGLLNSNHHRTNGGISSDA